jgi:hypothetical protein
MPRIKEYYLVQNTLNVKLYTFYTPSLYTMAQMNVVSGAKLAKNANPNGTYLVPLILVTSLFFMWGVANNLNDILIKQFQKAFELTDFQSGLVQSAFYFGYFVLAIPADFRCMQREHFCFIPQPKCSLIPSF